MVVNLGEYCWCGRKRRRLMCPIHGNMAEPPPSYAKRAGSSSGGQGPAGTIAVGTVTTLPPGSPATVTNVGTATAAIFDFGLPQGAGGVVASTGRPSLYAFRTSNQLILDNTEVWSGIGTPVIFNPATVGGQSTVQNKHRGVSWGGVYDDSVVAATTRPIYTLDGSAVSSYYVLHDEFCMFAPGYVPLGGPLYSWDPTNGPYAYFSCWKSGFYLIEATVTFDDLDTDGWRELQICESTYNSTGVWSGPTVRSAVRQMAVVGSKTMLSCSVALGVDGHYKVYGPTGDDNKRRFWGAGQMSIHVRQNSGSDLNLLGSTSVGSEPRLSVTFLRDQYDAWCDSNTPVEP